MDLEDVDVDEMVVNALNNLSCLEEINQNLFDIKYLLKSICIGLDIEFD